MLEGHNSPGDKGQFHFLINRFDGSKGGLTLPTNFHLNIASIHENPFDPTYYRRGKLIVPPVTEWSHSAEKLTAGCPADG